MKLKKEYEVSNRVEKIFKTYEKNKTKENLDKLFQAIYPMYSDVAMMLIKAAKELDPKTFNDIASSCNTWKGLGKKLRLTILESKQVNRVFRLVHPEAEKLNESTELDNLLKEQVLSGYSFDRISGQLYFEVYTLPKVVKKYKAFNSIEINLD